MAPTSQARTASRPAGRPVVALVVASCAWWVAGCRPSPDGGRPTASRATIGWELLGRSDERRAHDWTEHFVARCMARRGEVYRPVAYDPHADELGGLAMDLAPRRRDGFGISIERASPTGRVADDPNAAHLVGLPDAHRQRFLDGVQRCNDRASELVEHRRRSLLARLPRPDRRFVSRAIAGQLPAAERATSAWSECMAVAGWRVRDERDMLLQLEARARQPHDRPSVQSLERREAVDDWRCARHTIGPTAERLAAEISARAARVGVASIYEEAS
jgi:hypothetical protein